MCYPCLMDCENCKQKYLYCPSCGAKNLVVRDDCLECGLRFTVEIKEASRRAWEERTGKSAERTGKPAVTSMSKEGK